MSHFAAVAARAGSSWTVTEVSLADCESVDEIAEVAREVIGELHLVLIEEDDEYAALVRVDADDDEPRAFLSDGHSADRYRLAEIVAEGLDEIGEDALSDDEDAPPAHDSAPFGDAGVVEDLGLSGAELLALCAHEGTLPVDILVAVCERIGCGEQFEDMRV